MKIEELHRLFLKYPNVSTDTRKINTKDIFFALKGENFNGNVYAQQALKKGASYAIIDEQDYYINNKTILVKDVLGTLQKLASYHRNYNKAQIVSLTGSNGKTTTKELIHSVLSKKYQTVATKGNLNNHIGVPLTLLDIKEETEIAIIEMGANHQKEIAFLSSIAQPDYGYITNFGKAHLEGFGGVKGVIKGKSELYDYLITNQKHVFLNADDPIQKEKLALYNNKYGFSTNNPDFYKIEFLSANPFVCLKAENIKIQTQLIGAYNFSNCSAALLIGKYFNVELTDIKKALEHYTPKNNRSQIIEKKGFKIILDAYNANPTSMNAALENFAILENDNKILFLGDMFELGDSAEKEHQYIADLVEKLGFKIVFLIGENFHKTSTQFSKIKNFENLEKEVVDLKPSPKTSILIKGSRGMALERILDIL